MTTKSKVLWFGAFAKNTKVERYFDTKYKDIAKKNLQKAFFGIFCAKTRTPTPFFCLHKTAHFLSELCTFSARGKFLAPELRGEIFGDP